MTSPEQPLPVPPSPNADPSEAEPRLLWEAPKVARLGTVAEATQGISYNPLDGLFNLSP